ncbi:MAG: (2R)-ethylmalonyl-CoA mutase [Polyangiales bacterium]|jgi:(2R)-ethylmalonyl-CoA mutase
MRTYAGHSTAKASNELYRNNLAKGQSGLSIAFDLPTQTGYDADHPLARGEVGKVGVPVAHLGDMRALMKGLDPSKMNTSMTINATAMWLFALYVANAEEQGADLSALRGTTQNDIVKEYLSRGTYAFPPGPSMRLTSDLISFAVTKLPKWNPINICSYHLQEAGATPVQELAYALATAISVLDSVRSQVPEELFPRVVGRISFFVNAGIRFVEELCKMRAFVNLWERVTKERYGIEDPAMRRFRYGVQVNSLGLTEQQPENNIVRIVLEMLAVTLSKDARARAIQLPAWNEALGLPRPWDQQWSLRAQQVLAMETDLLEYDDLFTGSKAVEAKTAEIESEAWDMVEGILDAGGAVAAVENGSIKGALVQSAAARVVRIESGEQSVVGVNTFVGGEASPLVENLEEAIMSVDPAVESQAQEALDAWRSARDASAVAAALKDLEVAAQSDENLTHASIAAARAGVTTGEWAATLRGVFGEYRAPTGISSDVRLRKSEGDAMASVREAVEALTKQLGRRPKILVGKPGLDGHSNGAEQIAIHAKDAGFDVVYEGIRCTPERIAATALDEGVHLIGLSVLSGSHLDLVSAVIDAMKERSVNVPLVVGGIIPAADQAVLLERGVARVYTPRDFDLREIMGGLAEVIRESFLPS